MKKALRGFVGGLAAYFASLFLGFPVGFVLGFVAALTNPSEDTIMFATTCTIVGLAPLIEEWCKYRALKWAGGYAGAVAVGLSFAVIENIQMAALFSDDFTLGTFIAFRAAVTAMHILAAVVSRFCVNREFMLPFLPAAILHAVYNGIALILTM